MTSVTGHILLAVSLLSVACSQLLLKARLTLRASAPDAQWIIETLKDPWIWMGAILVLLGVVCWYLALMRLPLSFMMPMAVLISPVVSVGAWIFLGEAIELQQAAAIAVITTGALWLAAAQG